MEANHRIAAQPLSIGSPASHAVIVRELDIYQDLLPLHQDNPRRYPGLLESVAHGTSQARYDILFAFPSDSLTLGADNKLQASYPGIEGDDFLDNLDRWWRREGDDVVTTDALPFTGGWFVYLGYELVGQIEPGLSLPPAKPEEYSLPIACAIRFPAAVIRDHETKKTFLVAESSEVICLEKMASDLRQCADQQISPENITCSKIDEEDEALYLRAVASIKQYIFDGDVFQVNLSRQWQGKLDREYHAADIYQRLRTSNPAPFAGLFSLGDTAVISSSPERLVHVKGNRIETRPIAGTRPRASETATDNALSQVLLAHPKERAEHIMLIDLERNDIGKVAEPGSVAVDQLMVLESYAHVHHIVSNIHGIRRDEVTPGDIIRALFPGGTITGCPKVRCMEIIVELENSVRGPYTGSMGYLNRDGSMDLNILIRTLQMQGRQISFRAGAGIVADSVAAAELEETRAKARGLLLALGDG